ncbi:MAG: hypothetical protein AVDCRST_MAG95-1375 [uncultured Adhaeribacter sp.]|uniref:Lipoprotein n=1 Tax=uncultured Adhaeribacter sp. TaxID=448109 RepID=A0A6J4I1C5_9BACT|nr:MAG: hypothetical protein AVDCRST_MAG95-1375 [uncultured Adhaeribacter sp.]
MKKICIFTTFLALFLACQPALTPSSHYVNEQIPLDIQLPGGNSPAAQSKLDAFTKKQFRKHATRLAGESVPEILFFSRGNDNPDQVPYTGIGSTVASLDTAKLRATGFAYRQVNNQPYLHKTTIDRAGRIILSEYIVSLPDKYLYLFASAPITRSIRQNEEAMIVVQDSLNRKYGAAIGSLKATR